MWYDDSHDNGRRCYSGYRGEGKCQWRNNLSFELAVTKGYGTSRHTVYLQVWDFRAIAERLIVAKVKKGSQLLIFGDFDVVAFERKDGSKGTVNKVILQDWEFVGGSKNNEEKAEEKKSEPKAAYQEHYCTDDDELPL